MISNVGGVSFADYLAAIKSRQVQHAEVEFPNQSLTISENKIGDEGIEYQLLMNYEEDLTIGLAPCAMVHMYLMNYDGSLSSVDYTDEFTVSLGVEVSNGATPPVYTNTPQIIGYFIGQKPQRVDQKIIELTGYDRMILFETSAEAFFQQEANGKTAAEYFNDLCTYVGVTAKAIPNHAVNSTKYFATHPTSGTGMTCRNILAYLAELMGCYARIAMDGECELVWFSDHTADYTAQRNDQMEEPDVAEYTVPAIDKYQVKITANDIGVIVGSGTNGYITIDNPFLYGNSDDEIRPYATNIYNKISAFSAYKPGTFQVDGTWLVEPGDIISVVLENGTTMAFPVFNVSYIWNGSANIVYETTGQAERNELTAVNRQRLQEGYKFHELYMDVDNLISIIGDRSGHTTTIAQDIDHIELVAESKNSVWVSLTDPALDNIVNEGDIWVRQEFESWQDVYDNVGSWNALNDGVRTWAIMFTGESFFRKNSAWVRMTMNEEAVSSISGLREKYDIRSGIKIEPEGIEILGGKYILMKSGSELNIDSGGDLNIKSGGKLEIESGGDLNINSGGNMNVKAGGSLSIVAGGALDVKATNFDLNSQDKILKTGPWKITETGLSYDYDVTGWGQEIKANFSIFKGDFNSSPSGSIYKSGLCYDYGVGSSGGQIEFIPGIQLFFERPEYGITSYLSFSPYTIGQTTPGFRIDGTNILFGYENGYVRNAYIDWLYYKHITQTSSRDIKHDILPMPSMGDKLDKLQPVTFVYDDDPEEQKRYGLIYEDTIDVMPDICTCDETQKGINYVELIPMLLKEIQELRARVKALEEREGK